MTTPVQPARPVGIVTIADPTDVTHLLAINSDGSINATTEASSSVTINDPSTTTQKLAIDASGNASVKVTSAIPAGTNVIGHVIVDSVGGSSTVAFAGVKATPIAAGATGPTVIKASAGIFYGFLVTTVGAGAPGAYDNASAASGTVVGMLTASAPLGYNVGPAQGVQCLNGITISGGATMPGLTILWF